MEEQKNVYEKGLAAGKRKTPMKAAEFAIFFNDLYTIATDKSREDVSPLDILRNNGIEIDLPPNIEARLMPLLRTTSSLEAKASPDMAAKPKCGVCGVCGACALCGEINLGAPGAAAAAIWHIFGIEVVATRL